MRGIKFPAYDAVKMIWSDGAVMNGSHYCGNVIVIQ